MNEEQLIQFVEWLPTAVPEFKDATPEQIIQTLNQLYDSEEGQQTLSQLFTAFQEAQQGQTSQMFKKGGKLDAFVNKYKNGGACCGKKKIIQGGMVNKVAEKMQDGGETPVLTRREAREQAMNNRGFTRNQFQTAMINAKNALRGAGLRGRDLRQQARQMVAGQIEPISLISPTSQLRENSSINTPLESLDKLEALLPRYATTQQTAGIIQTPSPTFDEMFAKARNAGLKEFTYNGKKYNTLYKNETSYPGLDPKYNFRTPWSPGYTDLDLARQGTGYYVTAPEYQKDGGILKGK